MLLLYYPYNVNDGKMVIEDDPVFKSLSDKEQELVWQKYLEISISKNKTGPTYHRMPIWFNGKSYFFWSWPDNLKEVL